jgi:nicotinamidase-related amidase
MANVVLVVDMLRGFCEEGHPLYVGETIRQIIPGIIANPRLHRVI